MKVTKSDDLKHRQLQIEGYPQMVSAEQREYAEAWMSPRMTETDITNTTKQKEGLLEQILASENLNRAYKQEKRNKGAGGIDGMQVDELLPYLKENQKELKQSILGDKYRPKPVRRVEIPKENGKTRKLGIPTVVDRLIQQAMCQVLTPIFEIQFSDNSFGFRVMRILENTRYKGENDYPAIVTPALYDADQTVRASKRREVSRKVVATPTQTFTAPDYSPTSAIRRLENEINRAIDRAVSADVIKKLIFECASLKYESLNK